MGRSKYEMFSPVVVTTPETKQSKGFSEIDEMKTLAKELDKQINGLLDAVKKCKTQMDDKSFYANPDKNLEDLSQLIKHVQTSIAKIEKDNTFVSFTSLELSEKNITDLKQQASELGFWNLTNQPANLKTGEKGKALNDDLKVKKLLILTVCTTLLTPPTLEPSVFTLGSKL